MKLSLAAGGAVLLVLLTWLLLRGINTNASEYAETQQALDDFALAEASIGRDVLEARAGLLGNYDVLDDAENAMESAVGRIRLHAQAENLDPKPVEQLAAAVERFEELIESFKTSNSLLQNSLSYVDRLSTDPSFGALGDQFAPSATALAAAVLHLARDSSAESAKSLQQQIDRFEAQAPTGGPDGEAAHALLAHARLLSELLPQVEQTLRALVASPTRQPLEETREHLVRAQAAFEAAAQRSRVLLYVVALGLLLMALPLGQRLWMRTLKIRRLVDANIIGIFIWDFDGRILEANQAFLNTVGYDHADLVAGRIRWTDLTPPEWRDRDAQLIQEHRVAGTLQPFEKEYFRKDGSRVPVLLGVAAFEEGGNQGVAFVLDLTERKRAEERLRVQHTVAQILAEAVTIEEVTPRILRVMGECLGWDAGALWPVDRKAQALRCAEFWHKASIEVPEFERVSRESTFVPGLGLPGRVWSSLQPEYVPNVVSDENFPRGPIARREELHAAFAFPILLGGEALGVIEFFSREIRQPDQELLNVLATIGSQIGQFIERKRGEEALRRSQAWLTQAQRLSHIGTWVMNGTTRRFLYWSDESYRIWGLDPLQGLPSREDMWGRVHPDDRERVWAEVQEAMRQQRDFFAEFRILLPDGTVRYLEANTRHEFSALGALIEVICTSVDVTERKRAQDEHERLRQLESDLAHMNRVSMMGELAASLSHEITQPIASARNNARAAMNFLDERPPELGEIREALSCIVGDADRAGSILDRIRDQVIKAPPRKLHFDLNESIDEVLVLARSAISKNGISVQTRLADGLLPVRGDRVQLQQVVLNLILNAVEAMGSVQEGPRALSITTEQGQAKEVLVAIRDSGPGIDPANRERVFEAFYTTKSSGVGMGLSICRSIIAAHGGWLWVDANEPRGAAFQFTLPSEF